MTPTVQRLQSQAQKNKGNDAVLAAYSAILPPIAQLAKVPWTQTNLRQVDPVIQPPIYPNTINQNGNQ